DVLPGRVVQELPKPMRAEVDEKIVPEVADPEVSDQGAIGGDGEGEARAGADLAAAFRPVDEAVAGIRSGGDGDGTARRVGAAASDSAPRCRRGADGYREAAEEGRPHGLVAARYGLGALVAAGAVAAAPAAEDESGLRRGGQ